ncbi:hypothetical protein HMPREF1624_00179 [Sporothrix schenckii ATCC 58251]|uniref:Zn(2)-C6 fungal-type domain-containing protein n=1 Tax=Sporothrix schenckii (strain ATCC 58251 / de Perez 2211183) TaxID=1391915 RepID=U7Q4G9_SPOS1|nr:hypothetical protein HMPREF1624_00179 [Sporothrix schenckii ATCC 58251]
MEKRGPTAGAGNYGQACMQCFKAKCRCIARPDGGACERCLRLKKPCQPSNSARRRTAQNGQAGAGAAEIAELEGRINTLTTMLQSVMEKAGLAGDASTPADPKCSLMPVRTETAGTTEFAGQGAGGSSDTASMTGMSFYEDGLGPGPLPTPFHTPLPARPPQEQQQQQQIPPPQPPPPRPPPTQAQTEVDSHLPLSPTPEPPLYELSLNEAAWYLDRFSTHLLPHFPFIVLPPDTTVDQLCRDRPLLMQAIVAVATPSTKLKAERAERLKQTLTRCALHENQSGIDVLLSLLTYVTWSTDPFKQPANNLSRMTMLAISLVYDLQHASRHPPAPDAQFIAIMTPGFERPGGGSSGSGDTGRPMLLPSILEHQRAFLACFVLSSIVSASFGRMVAQRWTTQMEEGLQLIEATASKGDSPSDANFAVQVRLQVIIQRAALVREQLETDRFMAPSPTTAVPVTTNLFIKVLQGQLNELRSSLSPSLPRRDMLLIYSHYADLFLNEVTRLVSSEAPLAPTSAPSGHTVGGAMASSQSLPALEHIECLWRSVYAIKAFLDAYQAIPPLTYVGVPFFFWFQLVRCIVLLKHLATFNDPAWDGQAVRNAVDMSTMLEWMAVKAEQASKEAGEQSDDDMFRRVGSMMRNSLAWVVAKQRAVGAAELGDMPQKHADAASHYQQDASDLGGNNAVLITDAPVEEMMVPVDPPLTGPFDMTEENWVEEMFGWPMASI